MSSAERVYGTLKSIMLIQERFDALDKKLGRQETDMTALSRSHAELAQRVARIEGMIEGAAMAAGNRRPRIEG